MKNKIFFSGVGIHNGKAVSMSIEPSEPNTGIIFERTDIQENQLIKAVIENVDKTCLCTKIKNKHGVSVSTIEHLMAAFMGLKIDNALVLLSGYEVPIMDGSSKIFVDLINNIGIKEQFIQKKLILLKNKALFLLELWTCFLL